MSINSNTTVTGIDCHNSCVTVEPSEEVFDIFVFMTDIVIRALCVFVQF